MSTAVLGTAAVLKEAGGARISEEDPAHFAFHVAGLLHSKPDRERLGSASLLDARAWSAEGLMRRAVDLYASLAASASIAAAERANTRITAPAP